MCGGVSDSQRPQKDGLRRSERVWPQSITAGDFSHLSAAVSTQTVSCVLVSQDATSN